MVKVVIYDSFKKRLSLILYSQLKPYFLLLTLFICLYSNFALAIPQNFPFETPTAHLKTAYRAAYDYPDNFDPIRAYDDESNFYLAQIYESLYNIDYAADDFKISPMLAEKMPEIRFYDKENNLLAAGDLSNIEKTVYRIPIRHGIYYAPNPFFCGLDEHEKCDVKREVHASDFVYAISRVTHPGIQSPYVSVLNKHLYHFSEYYKKS